MKTSKILLKILKTTISILVIVLLIFGIFIVGRMAYNYGYRIFAETPIDEDNGKEVTVQVTEGMTGKTLGEVLKDKGLIRDTFLFQIQYRVSDYYGKIKPGLYQLNTTMNPETILETLSTVSEGKNDR